MSKQTKFEAACPTCGEKMMVTASEADVVQGKVSVAQKCQRCLNAFEAISDLDCLEWDDQCKIEVGRFG